MLCVIPIEFEAKHYGKYLAHENNDRIMIELLLCNQLQTLDPREDAHSSS